MRYSRTQERGDRAKVMQIVWPSAQSGKYLWNQGCPLRIIESQPPLDEGDLPISGPGFFESA